MTPEEVYESFRIAQSQFIGRPYRLPKDFDKHFRERLSEKNREALVYATKYFSTKWEGIRPVDYFACGFELFGKNFSYIKFFEKKIMHLYIQRDKIKKRNDALCKKSIVDSMKFAINYCKKNNIATIGRYCMLESNGHSLPVRHYLDNKVDQYFLVILCTAGLLQFREEEIAYIPYITQRYREIVMALDDIEPFTKQIKERIYRWEISMIS